MASLTIYHGVIDEAIDELKNGRWVKLQVLVDDYKDKMPGVLWSKLQYIISTCSSRNVVADRPYKNLSDEVLNQFITVNEPFKDKAPMLLEQAIAEVAMRKQEVEVEKAYREEISVACAMLVRLQGKITELCDSLKKADLTVF